MGQVTGIFELPTLSTRDKICMIVVSDVRVRVRVRVKSRIESFWFDVLERRGTDSCSSFFAASKVKRSWMEWKTLWLPHPHP